MESRVAVGRREVVFAVAVEVRDGRVGQVSGAERGGDRGRKRTGAAAGEHLDSALVMSGVVGVVLIDDEDVRQHLQVEVPVAREVARGDRPGRRVKADGQVARGPETAVAVAQEHVHVVVVCGREVEHAVVVEVARRERVRETHAGSHGSPEGAVAVAQQHTHGVVVPDREVQKGVVVEVAGYHGLRGSGDGIIDRGEEGRDGPVLQVFDGQPRRRRASAEWRMAR